MSQVPSGLGWELDDSYLKSNVGALATLDIVGGPSFPGQPIPNTPRNTMTRDLVKNNGLLVASGFSPVIDVYVMSEDTANAIVAAKAVSSGYYWNFLIAATSSPITIGIVWVRRSDGSIIDYKAQVNGTPTVGPNGLYLWDWDTGRAYDGPIMPVFNNLTAFANAIQVESKVYLKLNAGAAAACVARWYSMDGTELESPILISTVPLNTVISSDGTEPDVDMSTFDFLYQGARFYMTLIGGNSESLSTILEYADLRQFGAAMPSKVFQLLASESFANIVVSSAPDPYQELTEPSETDGGDGDDEIQNDDIDFTPAPTSMAVASGFITLFCPSQAELNALADYMWSPLFDVDTLKKLFANPMDCILGLSVIPVPIVPEGTKTVKVGGVSTTVSMGYTNHQYYPVDCGTVTIPKRWGAYMDYAPYTKLNIFLPYIGFRQISADDVMGKTLHLRYMIDILSGACNAELKVNNTVLYSWAGSCAMQIPITGNDWRSAITAGVSIAGSVAATVLSGGASAPMIAGTVASATVNSLALKPEVQRSGSLSSASGFLAAQRPYIVRTNPRNAIPANQNKYSGYPSFVTVSLGSLTGYNEVYSVHLENIPATGAELDEIETILKGGAIF